MRSHMLTNHHITEQFTELLQAHSTRAEEGRNGPGQIEHRRLNANRCRTSINHRRNTPFEISQYMGCGCGASMAETICTRCGQGAISSRD